MALVRIARPCCYISPSGPLRGMLFGMAVGVYDVSLDVVHLPIVQSPTETAVFLRD
jgi:hypothetical protein